MEKMTKKEIEWINHPNLYNDWIDSGKKESFTDYKEIRRKKFFNETTMNVEELRLLNKVKNFHYKDWVLIGDIIKEQTNQELINELKDIEKKLYHEEEFHVGMM